MQPKVHVLVWIQKDEIQIRVGAHQTSWFAPVRTEILEERVDRKAIDADILKDVLKRKPSHYQAGAGPDQAPVPGQRMRKQREG